MWIISDNPLPTKIPTFVMYLCTARGSIVKCPLFHPGDDRKCTLCNQSEPRDFSALFIARSRLFLFPFRSESKMVGAAS